MPEIDEYKPTNDGLPPLARAKKEDWNVFRGDRLDYNVMPGWAGSSWYFIRFIDPKNDKIFCDAKKLNYWNQVDLYICLLYTSPSPRDSRKSRMPSSA